MSHSSTALSRRRSEGPRRRSIVRVTMLIMLAMVTQACGSSSSSDTSLAPAGALENVVTADWKLQMSNDDGSPLDQLTNSAGVTMDKLIVNKKYRITAKVPVELLNDSNLMFVTQYQIDTGVWVTHQLVKVAADGSVSQTYVPVKFWPDHLVRLAAISSTEPTASVPAVASSHPIRFFQSVEHIIKIWNTTSNNLTIKVPRVYDSTSKTWSFFEFGVGIGETYSMEYFNTPAVAFSMILNKQQCFLSCTDRYMDWSWAPTGTGRTECSTVFGSVQQGGFTSGGTYTVKLSDNVDGQNDGWKTGIISGPLLGPRSADTNCTFTTRDRFDQRISNHPVDGALCILGAVAVLVTGVIVGGIIAVDAVEAAAAAAELQAEQEAAEEAAYEQWVEKRAAFLEQLRLDTIDASQAYFRELEADGASKEEARILVRDRFGKLVDMLIEALDNPAFYAK